MSSATAVPVIALTGFLGAGKTTLLNRVLRRPDARIGLVINDFGAINVDAGLVTGQIDEPASITGGCICCLPDDGGLDEALARLADPKLRLDVIIVEASGVAEPAALARIIRFSGVDSVRPGGVVDVIDAVNHFDTVDRDGLPPARYAAASLVVVNKLDAVPDDQRSELLDRITERVHELNPGVPVIGTSGGRIDPALLYDIADDAPGGQLSLRDLLVESDDHGHDHSGHGHHVHADAVTVAGTGCVDANAVFDLLENPPPSVYRMKGTIAVQYPNTVRRYLVNLVGSAVHIAPAPAGSTQTQLVAIGAELDTDAVAAALRTALAPVDGPASSTAVKRLQRYKRLSI